MDGLRRADAGHVPGRARPDDRLDRAADDRRRPRRPRPPVVGRHLVPARRHGLDADLRQARRHVRAQARVPGGDPHLPRRLDARRAQPDDGPADRLPRPAGHRRRRPDGRRAGDHRRHRPAARARPVHGPDRRGLRRRLRRRAAARRLPRRHPLVALGLLRQPADRHRSRSRSSTLRLHLRVVAEPAPRRLPRRGAACRRRQLPRAAHDLGRQPVRLGLGHDHRARDRRRRCCSACSSGRSAAPPSRSCR